jgi:hypothetical protein
MEDYMQITNYLSMANADFLLDVRDVIRRDVSRVAVIMNTEGHTVDQEDMQNCHNKYAVFADCPIGYCFPHDHAEIHVW